MATNFAGASSRWPNHTGGVCVAAACRSRLSILQSTCWWSAVRCAAFRPSNYPGPVPVPCSGCRGGCLGKGLPLLDPIGVQGGGWGDKSRDCACDSLSVSKSMSYIRVVVPSLLASNLLARFRVKPGLGAGAARSFLRGGGV